VILPSPPLLLSLITRKHTHTLSLSRPLAQYIYIYVCVYVCVCVCVTVSLCCVRVSVYVCALNAPRLQTNRNSRLPKNYKVYPGKMDHTTCLTIRVGSTGVHSSMIGVQLTVRVDGEREKRRGETRRVREREREIEGRERDRARASERKWFSTFLCVLLSSPVFLRLLFHLRRRSSAIADRFVHLR
jgi:hypothetical protein